jgi:hypothetical protein
MTDRIRQLAFLDGMSVIVGTADGDGVPASCRGIAIRPAADFSTAIVYVPVATSRDIVANAATTKRLAVAVTNVFDNNSVQFKGIVSTVRLADDEESEFVRTRLYQFAESLDAIGIPRRIVRSLNHLPAFALEMKIEEIYDQTPGPKAGSSVR